jgi:trimethyllysine dioxygenase
LIGGILMKRLIRKYSVKVVQNSPKVLKLQWKEGLTFSFLPIWLRDHCQCNQCIHSLSLQRKIDTFEILKESMNLKVEKVSEMENNIHIQWKSNQHEHQSVYPIDFLKKFSQENIKKKSPFSPLYEDVTLWDSSLDLKNGMISYQEAMKDNGLLKLMEIIRRFGFCIVNGTPTDSMKPSRDLIEKVSHTRKSIFGDFWEFTV